MPAPENANIALTTMPSKDAPMMIHGQVASLAAAGLFSAFAGHLGANTAQGCKPSVTVNRNQVFFSEDQI